MPAILASPNPKVVAAVDVIVTSALGGILFDLVQYHNLSSECVTEPCSRNYGRFYYWAGYIGKNKLTT